MEWVFPGRRSLAAGRWGLWGLHTEMCLWGRAGRVQSVRACAHMGVRDVHVMRVARQSGNSSRSAVYTSEIFLVLGSKFIFLFPHTRENKITNQKSGPHCSSVSRQSAERKDKRYKRISFVPKYRLSSTFSYGNQKTAPPRPRWRGLQYEARRLGACSRLAASGKSSQAKPGYPCATYASGSAWAVPPYTKSVGGAPSHAVRRRDE